MFFQINQLHKNLLKPVWGKGKGSVEYWVAVIKPGRVLFEMSGVEEELAREALRLAAAKLPCKTKFVKRIDPISGQEVS